MSITKKTALALMFTVIMLVCSAFAINVSAADTVYPKAHNDLVGTLRQDTYLVPVDSGYMRVIGEDKTVRIEYYNDKFDLKSTKSLKMELDIWGGFYESDTNYYLVEGRHNTDCVDGSEVLRVIKYTKSWKRVGAASVKAYSGWEDEICYIFDVGCVSFAEANGRLYIATAREGYPEYEGTIGHQGMIFISVDTDNMKAKIVYGDFWHSFSQRLAAENNNIYLLEESEGSRATTLSRYDASTEEPGNRNDFSECFAVLEYGGERTSSWAIDTYASADDIAVSKNNVLGIGTSIDQSKYDTADYNTPLNIYLSVTPKNDLTAAATKIKWLTSGKSSGNCFTGLHLTKINDNRFLVSWGVFEEEKDTLPDPNDALSRYVLHYVFIDETGKKLTKEFTAEAAISNCQPVLKGNRISYSASSANMVNFYSIDANTGAFSKKCCRTAGEKITWKFSSGTLTFSGSGAIDVDTEVHYIYPLATARGGYVYSSSDDSWELYREIVTGIEFKKGITSIPDYSFKWFGKLNKIVIGEGLKSIGTEAFALYGDHGVDITIPESTTSFGTDFLWSGYYPIGGESHLVFATIHTKRGSPADKYARKNGIGVEYLKTDISSYKITIPYASYTYRGRGIKPTVTVSDSSGSKLRKGTDYNIIYSDNTNIGTATITVTGCGEYTGTLKKTFKVKPLDLSSSYAKVTIPYCSYTYSGKALKPEVTVKFKTGAVINESEYSLSYSNNVKVGVATITVKGKGQNVMGTYKKTFVVKPAKNEITSISSAKGAFKISWKKGTVGTVGYQVLYSTDKNFKNNVHSYTSVNLNDLNENFSKVPNSGETWYVKVRSFYTKDGKATSTRYGNYSAVKSIKVK